MKGIMLGSLVGATCGSAGLNSVPAIRSSVDQILGLAATVGHWVCVSVGE